MEQWICAEPGCGLILVMGISIMEIPCSCPRCGGQKWDIKGDINYCKVNGLLGHEWNKGVDVNGIPHLDPDQICRACGAVPVMEGIGN